MMNIRTIRDEEEECIIPLLWGNDAVDPDTQRELFDLTAEQYLRRYNWKLWAQIMGERFNTIH